MRRRRQLVASLAGSLLAAGCSSGPALSVNAYDAQVELERRDGFALVAPMLDDDAVWAYGAPASALQALRSHYLPAHAAARAAVAPLEQAPPRVAEALTAAKAALVELGYTAAAEGEPVAFVVALALTWTDVGTTERVSVRVGATIRDEFRPDRIVLSASAPPVADAAEAVAWVRHLLSFLPPRQGEGR